jgi:hypothetical protein
MERGQLRGQLGGNRGFGGVSHSRRNNDLFPSCPLVPRDFGFEPRRSRHFFPEMAYLVPVDTLSLSTVAGSRPLPALALGNLPPFLSANGLVFENHSHIAGVSTGILHRRPDHPVMVCRRGNFPVFLPRIFR